MSNVLRLLIMGPPGSGKGTISSRIVKDFAFTYLACGDLLRSHILKKTKEGLIAKGYIDEGNLVPDKIVTDLMFKELNGVNCERILLDGFPRTIDQAEDLSQQMHLDSVIDLKVPDEEIIKRLQGRLLHEPSGRIYHTQFKPPKAPWVDDVTGEALVQRTDDMPETVKARLKNYKILTKPLQDYYRNKNILNEFTGKDSNEIWGYVNKYLEKILSKPSV